MVELKAIDLVDKFGFAEGMLFFDILEDAGFDCCATRPVADETWEDEAFDHAVLAEVVRTYLCPKLVGYEIDTRCSLSHNPVRVVIPDGCEGTLLRQSLEGIAVSVTDEQVLEIARGLARDFPDLADVAGLRRAG